MIDLYRLVYASKNLLRGTEADTAAAVQQILVASQRNNSRIGVTGALMFNAGAFAQVLEGSRSAVEETFERIQRDLRHSDVTVLQCGPVESRSFANWSMAFVGQSAEGQAQFSRLAAESGFDLSRLSGDSVFAMLHGLVMEEEGAPSLECSSPSPMPVEEHDPATLDIDQIRSKLAQLRPAIPAVHAFPAVDMQQSAAEESAEARYRSDGAVKRPPGGASEGVIAVLKAALVSERQRTTELRGEVDLLQIALARSQDQLDAMRNERNLWAGRARLLATALAQEARDLQGDVQQQATSTTQLEQHKYSTAASRVAA